MIFTTEDTKTKEIFELVRGASLSFANAENLFSEAKLLSANKAFSRALFLHH
ncbi:MAG: hypothetical protein JW804_01815 [Sedimentisphaerales bacterium]|nr:hypothetical protein [Sedimentisphaerales bacterium]